MKSHFTRELSDAAIATLLQWDARRPTPETLVAIRTLGGAVGRVSAEESAYPHRAATFNVSIDATWSDSALDGSAIAWSRASIGRARWLEDVLRVLQRANPTDAPGVGQPRASQATRSQGRLVPSE
ncbi:hypothetical protein BH23GEM9_BH23GEM9_10760 [soil metagenome]